MSKIFCLIVLQSCQLQNRVKQVSEFYILMFDKENKAIDEGYIHLLSNDHIVNDISFSDWDMEEKKGINPISKNGLLKITKGTIEMNNKLDSDSIAIVYRWDKGLGAHYIVPLDSDTIKVRGVLRCESK